MGTTLEEAEVILSHRHKIEKLPVVDAEGLLRGLITVKDISKRIAYPDATRRTTRGGCGRLPLSEVARTLSSAPRRS